MKAQVFEQSDLPYLKELEPPDWGDLVPRFTYFMESPACHPIKLTENNQMIGVGTSILHEDTAWLATIIVHPGQRNKGIGKVVTQTLVDSIDRQTYKTIYLEATDMGYPVYKKLGFEVETVYNHYKPINISAATNFSDTILNFHPDFTEQVLELDKEVSGEGRQRVLMEHIGWAKVYLHNKQLQGYFMPTLGDGLIIAKTSTAGLALMQCRFADKNNAVIPVNNTKATNYLNSFGYTPYRTSRRMFLGDQRPTHLHYMYNRISGQLG